MAWGVICTTVASAVRLIIYMRLAMCMCMCMRCYCSMRLINSLCFLIKWNFHKPKFVHSHSKIIRFIFACTFWMKLCSHANVMCGWWFCLVHAINRKRKADPESDSIEVNFEKEKINLLNHSGAAAAKSQSQAVDQSSPIDHLCHSIHHI